jgi:N-dimethylarginine dimethylaminohydrolase
VALVYLFGEETGVSVDLPATFGGAGWRRRNETHRQEVAAGIIWNRCGTTSEFGELKQVTLCRPRGEFPIADDPNDLLFLEWPNQANLLRQALAIGAFYESLGIVVNWTEAIPGSPNFIFQRDLYFMTPEGAVIARPGSVQRASEARAIAIALSRLGAPIIGMPIDGAIFEGADALWLDRQTVLLGIGCRTNQAGAQFLARLLHEFGVDLISISLPTGVQHLLGIVNFIDRDLAAVRSGTVPDSLAAVLREAAVNTIACGPGPDISQRFGMNFVSLGPRHVVMPSGCPTVRNTLVGCGVRVEELDVSEYLKAAGGLGCLTGILHRQD